MHCPNCSEAFRLVADYASHLQRCRPLDVDAGVSEWLLAKLNAATESIGLDLGIEEAEEAAEPALIA
jgi:hypothetical protein